MRMAISLKNKRIIISKTNQIGDVVFALPIASALKAKDPSCTVIVLARAYTKDLVDHYADVDEFADWEEIEKRPKRLAIQALQALNADIILHVQPKKMIARYAKLAKIRHRIGTFGRIFHWFTCNRLVKLSRKKSKHHETQLDMKIMAPLGIKKHFSINEIIKLQRFTEIKDKLPALEHVKSDKFNLILHPLTRSRNREWPLEKFAALIKSLPKTKFRVFITGVEKEGEEIRPALVTPFKHKIDAPEVIDLTGKLCLKEFMHFISKADGLICASTGPVHLAAAFGIRTLGLYAPIKPFHAGRWGPIGKQAEHITLNKACEACRNKNSCPCIEGIGVSRVKKAVMAWL